VPIVVRAKALKETEHQLPILRRSARELMARPMVLTHRNENVFVDIEWSSQPLCKDIDGVVIAIGTIVKFNPKCVLPLLGLQNGIEIGSTFRC
jgi:hypothetical protein